MPSRSFFGILLIEKNDKETAGYLRKTRSLRLLAAPRRTIYSAIPFAVFLICLFLFIAAGCKKAETISGSTIQEKPLVLGLVPEINVYEELERYELIADYLSGKIGRKIELTMFLRYGDVVNNFVTSDLDGAFFDSYTYVLAHSKLGVVAVARPETVTGQSTVHGVIFVRKDSGIKSIRDMKGKRFVFVDKATIEGYLLPLIYFKESGVDDYKKFFKETYFAGTHEDAINDVLDKKADIGAAKNTIFDHVAQTDSRIKNELLVLRKSPEVPENGLALKKDIDPALKNALKEALLMMHSDPEGREVLKKFGASRFIETTNKDYCPVYKYLRDNQVDLRLCDYRDN